MEALAQRILEAACGLACRAGKVAECATASCRNQHTCLQTLKHNMTQQATEHGIEATAWSCSSRGSCCTSPPSTTSASFRLLAKHSASFGVGARHVRDEVSRFGLPNNELQSDVVGMLSVSLEFHYTGTLSPFTRLYRLKPAAKMRRYIKPGAQRISTSSSRDKLEAQTMAQNPTILNPKPT